MCFSYLVVLLFFFFFQAEDGIRDVAVTGVQTCALPILEAAVDVEDLPCHVGSPVSGQESYHFRHLTGGSDALERHLRQQRVAGVRRQRGGHVGLDEPGRHRVHQNAPVRKLARGRFRQPDQPRFGGRVVRLAGVAHGAGGGGDVDDAPPGLPAHHRLAGGAGHEEGALEIGLQHAVPVLVLHPDDETVARDARVVDEHVEVPEALAGHLHQPVGGLAPGRVRHQSRHRRAVAGELLQRDVQPVGVAARDDHAGAVLEHPGGDGEADPARAAGDDRDLAAQIAHLTPATALSRPWGSSTAKPRASPTMRRVSAVSTRPGPTSTNAVAPSAARRCTHSVQRTGLATWRRRNGTTSLAARVTPASTLRTTGIAGSLTARPASSLPSRSAAGVISEQWNGALTGRSTLLRPPRSAARATARSTAGRSPAMTICCAEFTLATSTTCPCAASRVTASTASSGRPMMAAMAPVPTGTASCMNSPRLRTTLIASRKRIAPATTSAEYSPRLWPAASAGRRPRSAQAAAAATLAVRTAGCVLAVSASSLSGPSNITRRRSKPRAALASSKTARAPAEASWNALPMPTDCEPWPGKRNAIIDVRSSRFRSFHRSPQRRHRFGSHYHRISAVPHAKPPPKAAIRIKSPFLMRPAASASSSATYTDAAPVLP